MWSFFMVKSLCYCLLTDNLVQNSSLHFFSLVLNTSLICRMKTDLKTDISALLKRKWIKWVDPNLAVDHVSTWLCVVMETQTVPTDQMRTSVDPACLCLFVRLGSSSVQMESVWHPAMCVMDGLTVALLMDPMNKVFVLQHSIFRPSL